MQTKEEKQAYMKSWYQATRPIRLEQQRLRREKHRNFLDQIKLKSGCVVCGFNEHPEALDFDHVPALGPKLFEIGANRTCSLEKLAEEIKKCEVVCANCHRIRTFERRNGND